MAQNVLQSDDLTVDLSTRKVFLGDEEVRLSDKEFDILVALMERKGEILTREWLTENILGRDHKIRVDTYIEWLRKKIEIELPLRRIVTVRGVGYRFDG